MVESYFTSDWETWQLIDLSSDMAILGIFLSLFVYGLGGNYQRLECPLEKRHVLPLEVHITLGYSIPISTNTWFLKGDTKTKARVSQ